MCNFQKQKKKKNFQNPALDSLKGEMKRKRKHGK